MGLSLVIPVQLFLNHVYLYFHVSIRRGGATATSNREPDRTQLENVFRVGRCRVGTQVIQCEHLDGRRISTCDDPTRREGGGTLIRTDPYQETTNPRTRLGPTTVGLDRMRPLGGRTFDRHNSVSATGSEGRHLGQLIKKRL